MQQGTFRSDLLYRLNVLSLALLPLRQRRDDIIPIAEFFLQAYGSSRSRSFAGFSDGSKQSLVEYDYPGNARALRNIVERAAILSLGGEITPQDLNLPRRPLEDATIVAPTRSPADDSDGERKTIVLALEQSRWNRKMAATMLGMPYSTLRYKCYVAYPLSA